MAPRLTPAGPPLGPLSLPGLIRCGSTIRDLGRAASSFDSAASSLVRHLHRELGEAACGGVTLVHLYRTRSDPHPGSGDRGAGRTLLGSPESPDVAAESPDGAGPSGLVLVASTGDGEAPSGPPGSAGLRSGGTAHRQAAALLPRITGLVRQLGVDAATAGGPAPELVPDRPGGRSHVFLMFDVAATSGSAGAADRGPAPGIRSVIGVGDLLPSGEHVAAVIFSTAAVSRETASLFGILAHSITLALLPFVDGGGEHPEAEPPAEAPAAVASRAAAVERLLQAQEQALQGATLRAAGHGAPPRRAPRGVRPTVAHRSLLCDRAAQALAMAASSGRQVSLILLGLDGFRVVNDTLGHRAGDRVLRAVGDRLRSAVRAGDTVAHMGADEFAVLLPAAGTAVAAAVAHRVVEMLRAPVTVNGETVYLSASVGVAGGDGGSSPATPPEAADRLIADADLAMYAAKAGGREAIEVFDRTLHRPALGRQALHAELRRVEDREFFLEYQPVVSLADAGLDGAEALLRWRHPSRGLVRPGDFIAAAEQTGQIVRIGAWVLETACREAARWASRAPGSRRPSIAVNVSCRQLREQGFADAVLQTLRSSGLRPSQLVLEVTESVLVEDLEAARTQLERVRAQGVRIAVDDFGAGFSSLGYLRALPLDIVKIDRMFVAELGTSEEDRALTLAIVRLLGTVEARIVAEGIETSAQLAYVHALGIDAGQGFYLGRPVLPGVFSRLLDQPVADWDGILDHHGDADAQRQRSAALSVLSDLPLPLRTVLVEDDPVLRAQLRALLEGVGDVEVVGEAGEGRQAAEVTATTRPDVILLGARTAARGGAGAVHRMRSGCPQARVVVVSALGAMERRAEAERLGADEYVATGTSLAGVVSVLRDAGARRAGTCRGTLSREPPDGCRG